MENSWPSSALIITSYKTDFNFKSKLYKNTLLVVLKTKTIKKEKVITIEASFLCGGTLLNRKSKAELIFAFDFI